MRTTVRLDEALMQEVKRYAAERSTTLTRVIEEALREKLNKREAAAQKPYHLPTHRGGGLQPGVNLEDNSVLLDLMDGLE